MPRKLQKFALKDTKEKTRLQDCTVDKDKRYIFYSAFKKVFIFTRMVTTFIYPLVCSHFVVEVNH